MPKYAPPDDRGRKPYVRWSSEFGRSTERILYAANIAEVRRHANALGAYDFVEVRRATPADVETMRVAHGWEANRP